MLFVTFRRFSSFLLFFFDFHHFSSFFIVFHRVSSFFVVFRHFLSFLSISPFSSFFVVFRHFRNFCTCARLSAWLRVLNILCFLRGVGCWCILWQKCQDFRREFFCANFLHFTRLSAHSDQWQLCDLCTACAAQTVAKNQAFWQGFFYKVFLGRMRAADRDEKSGFWQHYFRAAFLCMHAAQCAA